VLYGTVDSPEDENGRPHHAPIRAAGTPFLLCRRAEAALVIPQSVPRIKARSTKLS
jgi:hypothetical protein